MRIALSICSTLIALSLVAWAEEQPIPTPSEEDIARQVSFFTAILDNDRATFDRQLADGMNPNVTVPIPAPEALTSRIKDELLLYYVANDPGFSALMMTALLGRTEFVKALLAAGADPVQKTNRHKTFALWLAGKQQHTEIAQLLLGIDENNDARHWRISIDLTTQRATLWHNDQVELETPISSGRKSHPTPKGEYVITNKYKSWKSNLYPAKMPFFMRLSSGDFGLHVGHLPGYPASHGCIRLPAAAGKKMFQTAPIGTVVNIQ